MSELAAFYNTSNFSEIPINQKTNHTLFKSSFLKFIIKRSIPSYISKFLPADIKDIYLYFSSEFKNNMFFIIVRDNKSNEKNVYRILALSSIFHNSSEINFVIEYEPQFDSSSLIKNKCDKFFESILQPIGDPEGGKNAYLLFHRSFSLCRLKIKLNKHLLKEGNSFIIIPSLYEWLQFEYNGYGNEFVNCSNINYAIYGHSNYHNINILCGLGNLGLDIQRIQNLEGIFEKKHYFISGDTYWFRRRSITYNFQSRGASIPNPNNPESLRFTFGFDYYQGDNARDGQIVFEIPLSQIDFISSKIRVYEERINNNTDDLPF